MKDKKPRNQEDDPQHVSLAIGSAEPNIIHKTREKNENSGASLALKLATQA